MINDRPIPQAALPDRRRRRQQPARRATATARSCTTRGILYAPDYVINAGGLINVYNELDGYNRERAMRMARGIYANLGASSRSPSATAIPTYMAADRLAEERISAIGRIKQSHQGALADRPFMTLREVKNR